MIHRIPAGASTSSLPSPPSSSGSSTETRTTEEVLECDNSDQFRAFVERNKHKWTGPKKERLPRFYTQKHEPQRLRSGIRDEDKAPGPVTIIDLRGMHSY